MGKTESVSGYFPHVLLLWYDRDKQLAVTVFLSPVSVCCDRDALPLSLWNLAFSATHPEVTACWRDVQKLSALAFSVCSLMALESRWRNVRTDTYPAHPHNAVTTVLHPPCGPLGALRDSFFFLSFFWIRVAFKLNSRHCRPGKTCRWSATRTWSNWLMSLYARALSFCCYCCVFVVVDIV